VLLQTVDDGAPGTVCAFDKSDAVDDLQLVYWLSGCQANPAIGCSTLHNNSQEGLEINSLQAGTSA